ncbi:MULTISPECIES: hypothetical protein [Moorena]|uniref:Uncharacterized protein n=1 Tax=Moorena producens 3L TaxID=489825 RepID=F4XWH8_9CYAN|nr:MULTISPECIES: hypothetical protein [Moorena]EGJ31163.1 hypothetical protein LYNGBM3L_43430 [Moorena producens 3L]NEP67700.1 hypothetical protein [Moorena sp. SIO3A5]NER86119.1 hypothetical protein [Moorena sp. SIO3A2]NES43836.1 hypothetical protein [Moorena sp. SIO2C4]NET62895.1 hypothetical protein [Moorena sp. SIO1G6]
MGRFLLRVIIGSHSNQVNKIFSQFPIPDSRFPIPDSLKSQILHITTEVPPKFELLETSIPSSVAFLGLSVLIATGYSLIENAHNVYLKGV